MTVGRVALRVAPALLLIVAACDRREQWHGTVETLPNGAVRVTNPAQGVWQDDTAWRLVPELALGVVEGDDALMFSAIAGLEVGDDGRIYVIDRHANELRIFAADGSHLRTVGRSGGGPGEYANANGLLRIDSDTLLVIDQRGNRYSVLDREGAYIRAVPRRLPFYGWLFQGGYHDGRIYESFSVGTDPDRVPALVGTSLGSRGGSDALRAVRDEAGAPPVDAALDTVLLPRTEGPQFEAFSVRNERGGMMMGVPFAPGSIYRIDRRGTIWHGHGSEFRIVRSTFAGDTLLEIVLDATPAPVTDAELEEWQGSAGVARFREMGGRLDLSRIPRTKPFFEDVYLDPDGHLWVLVPAAAGDTELAIFDADARYLGRLRVSGLERERGLPPVVRNDRLYLVGRDDLGVQRVHVLRIER